MNDNIKAGSDIHAGDGGYSIGTKEKYDKFVKGRNQSLGKERIQQLAEQAEYTPDMFGVGHWDMPECKKFAELIVAECMRQVEEQYKPVMEDTEMMKDTHWDGYVQCGVDSYVAIREHFYGVEE